ncbi:MAG TPA: GFA family protein [Burkholderiales bacterium]|nr:GFA family protein [Burkholderiales bacterium]
MRIEGGCHCGRVSYEAEADPEKAGLCHCADCQTLSGSPYVAYIPVAKDGFKLRGEPKIYVKTAASGNRRAQAFCPDCGARLWASAVSDPQVFNLRLGGVRQRAQLPPKAQVWCDSALPWSMDLTAVKKHAKQAM